MPSNLRAARRYLGSTTFGVATGVGLLSFFLALGEGVRDVIQGEIFPIERLEVVPARGGLTSLELLASGSASGKTIWESEVEAVKAIEGVEAVYPRMRLGFPARAWGGEKVFGQTMWTELVVDGIPADLVHDEAGEDGLFRDWAPEDSGKACNTDGDCLEDEYCSWEIEPRSCAHPVPFLISRYLVELYNGSIVTAHDLPRLPEWVLNKGRGLRVNMEVGRSSLGQAPAGRPRKILIVFAGVSEHAMDIGITVPLAYVRRWNAEFEGTGLSSGYSSLTVLVKDGDMVTPVAGRLASLGLAIESRGAEQVGLMVTLFEATFAAISILVLMISAFNISHAFFLIVRKRRREIGVMRAVGATRADILAMFLAEGALVGLAGSIIGLVLAVLGGMVANHLAAIHLPEFPFKPDDFFCFPLRIVATSLIVGVLSSMVGVLAPAVSASREDPTRSLA